MSLVPALQESYWAPIAAVVVLYPDGEATRKAAMQRFIGTTVGSLVGWECATWWHGNIVLCGLGIAVGVGTCYLMRLENASRLRYALRMDVIFLFLDESCAEDAAWLTGVAVPAERYAAIRDAMLQVSVDAQRKAGIAHPYPYELHAVDLLRDLPEASDERRLAVFSRTVDLVNAEQLEVISVGYSGGRQIRGELDKLQMPEGDKLYGLNFNAVFGAIRIPPDGLLLPVFDGVPGANAKGRQQPVDASAHGAFLQGVHHSHHYRVAHNAPGIYAQNFRNVAEPTFSDSARSPLLQLADLVGYLLAARDLPPGKQPSAFKASIVAIARTLNTPFIRRIEHTMGFSHVVSASP